MTQFLVVLRSFQTATCESLHVFTNSEESPKAERPKEILEFMVWLIGTIVDLPKDAWYQYISLFLLANPDFETMPVLVSYFHSSACDSVTLRFSGKCFFPDAQQNFGGLGIDPCLSAFHRAVMSDVVIRPCEMPWKPKNSYFFGKCEWPKRHKWWSVRGSLWNSPYF